MEEREKLIQDIMAENAWPWFPTLSQALGMLPGVSARVAKRALDGWREQVLLFQVDPDKHPLPQDVPAELASLYLKDSYGNPHVSPAGARLLLELFEQGRIPLAKKGQKSSDGNLEELRKLASSDEEFRLKAEDIISRREARARLVENPETVPVSEFSESLFNSIFARHLGKGSGKLTIGGVEVRKSVSGPVFSNSGKNYDFKVTYSWKDPETQESRSFQKDAMYGDNRRNDADRNWGLGRE